MILSENFKDLKSAEEAFKRVQAEIDAVAPDALSPMNVDLVSATSIVLGMADGIIAFKERIAKLPEFDMKSINHLIDYALAAWYLYVTNLPTAEPADADALMSETQALRAKLLLWGTPLAASGFFEPAAVDRIKEGAGNKDAASDLVALVGLFRSRWPEISTLCAVTEEDLVRGSELGPLMFALVARRENKAANAPSDASLRIRRAWTLVDKAYGQCRRAIQYFRDAEADVDRFAPTLRRNTGRSTPSNTTTSASENTSAPPVSAQQPTAGGANTSTTTGSPGLGGASSPFTSSKTG